MRVFGIDPGTATTGFGVIETDGPGLVDAGVVRTSPVYSLQRRLRTIYREISDLLVEYQPREVAIEELYFAANVKTAISVSHARGVLLLAAAQYGVEAIEYTPLQIKQALTGYGRAEKHQIQEMVRQRLCLGSLPKPDDAADALAVAICHSQVVAP